MTDTNKETGNELFVGEYADHSLAASGNTVQRPAASTPMRREKVISPESPAPGKSLTRGDRFAGENLKVKKEMAIAFLKMGIAKKDVMQILNVVIK